MTLVGDPRSGRARSRSGGRESSQARGGDPYGGRGGGGGSGSGGGDKPSWDIEAAVENRVEYLKSKYGGEAEKFLNRENIRRKLEEAHSSGVYKSTGQVESSYQGSPVSRIEAAERREFREATHRVFEIRSNVGEEPSRQELEQYRGGLGEDVYRRELRGIEKQDLAEQYSRLPFVYNDKKYFGEAAGEKILQLQESGKYQGYLKRQELERQKRERDQMLYENRMREFGRRRERFLTETGLKIGVKGFNVVGAVSGSKPEPVESKKDSRRVVKMGMVPEIPEGVRDRVGVAASNYFSKLKGKKTFLGAKLTVVKDVLELPGDVAQEGLGFFERKIEPKIKPYVPAVALPVFAQEKIKKHLGGLAPDYNVKIEGFEFTSSQAKNIFEGQLRDVRKNIGVQEGYLRMARSDEYVGDVKEMSSRLSEMRSHEKDLLSKIELMENYPVKARKAKRDELKTTGGILGYSLGVGLPVSGGVAAASYVGRFGLSYLGAVGAQKGIKRLPLEKLPGGQTTEDVLALGGGILAGGVVMGASGAVERKLANALKSPRVSQQVSQVNLVSGDKTAGSFMGSRSVKDFYGTRSLGKVMGSFKEKPGVGVLRYATQGKGSLGTTRSSVGKMVYGFSDDVRNLRPSGWSVGGRAPVPAGKFINVPSSGSGSGLGFKLPTDFQGVKRTASFRGLEGRALSVGRKALKSTKTLKGDVVSRSGVAARQVGDDVWMGFSKTQSQGLKPYKRSVSLGRKLPKNPLDYSKIRPTKPSILGYESPEVLGSYSPKTHTVQVGRLDNVGTLKHELRHASLESKGGRGLVPYRGKGEVAHEILAMKAEGLSKSDLLKKVNIRYNPKYDAQLNKGLKSFSDEFKLAGVLERESNAFWRNTLSSIQSISSRSAVKTGVGRSLNFADDVIEYLPSGRDRVVTESRFLTRVLDKVDDVGAVGSGGGVSRSVGGGGGGSVLQAKLDSVGLIQRSPPKTSDLSGLVSEVLEGSSKSVSQSQADIGFTQSLAGGLAAFASRKPKTTSKQQVKTASPMALEKPLEQEGLYSPASLMKPTLQDGGGVSDLDVMPSLSTLQETGGGLMQIHKPRMESVSRVSQAPRRLTSPSSDLVRGDLSKPIRELSPVLALEAGLTSGLVSDSGLKPLSSGVPPAPMSGISGVPPGLIPGFGPKSGYGGGGFNFERFWKIENPLSIPDLEDGIKKRRRKKENGFGFF